MSYPNVLIVIGVTGHISYDEDTLQGKVALVTGSTSGIGQAIAECLAKRGCNIILNGFGDPLQIQNLQSDLNRKYGCKVDFAAADLSKPEEIVTMSRQIFELYPQGIDVLVNNAGMQYVSPVELFPVEKWDLLISVMLSAPFHLIQKFLPAMKAKGWGRIVNISSAHGLVASPNKAAYVSAKHGIIGLSKVIALETAGSGVTCNSVCPGYVETPLFLKQAEERSAAQGISVEAAKKQIIEVHPSGETVKVDEVGDTVCFLCSQAASQITGTSITIDGGWTAR